MELEPFIERRKLVADMLRQIVEARTRLLERAAHASTCDDEIDKLTIDLLEAKIRLSKEE